VTEGQEVVKRKVCFTFFWNFFLQSLKVLLFFFDLENLFPICRLFIKPNAEKNGFPTEKGL